METETIKEVTMDQLPEEMMLKIFEFMDEETLKQSTLVCKQWNEIIGKNASTMKKLPLYISTDADDVSWKELLKQSKDLTRVYQTICIDGDGEWTNAARKFLNKHASETRHLKLKNCFFDPSKANLMRKILCTLKKVEVITLEGVENEALDMDIVIKPADLPNLKKIVFHDGSLKFFDFIKTAQLTTLMINSSTDIDDDWSNKYLLDVLSRQTKLEQLCLRDVIVFGEAACDEMKRMKFPLKRLSLHKQEVSSSIGDKDFFQAFLSNFEKTLEELELGHAFSPAIYEMIFTKLHKLKVVNVFIKYAPNENSFYHNLHPNPAIRKLIIHGFEPSHQLALEGFIGNMPNIETLVLGGSVTSQVMLFISNNLPKLKNLHLDTITGQMFERHLRIASVDTISIKRLPMLMPSDWKSIVKAFPNVEIMLLEQISHAESVNDRMFNIFTKSWKKLRCLKLGQGFVAIKRVFNQILANCPQFKTLHIAESAFENPESKKETIFKTFKRDGLRLIVHPDGEVFARFPESKGLWSDDAPQFYNFYTDEDDEDSDDDGMNAFMMMGQLLGALGGAPFGDWSDDDSDDDRYIYFDSDGEPRYWDEDPSDYGIFDDNYYFLD